MKVSGKTYLKDYPSRIICLTEESTELFYLLGEDRRIVGISVYTKRPERAKKEKVKVSAFVNANLKKIRELNPDLIIGFSDIQANLAKELIQLGYTVLVTNQRSLEEIFNTMLFLAKMVGQEKKGKSLIKKWVAKLAKIHKESQKLVEKSGGKKPRVFFQEWDEPLISGITWVGELIEICGGIEIFHDLKDKKFARDRIVVQEEIAKRDPEIWLNSWCGKKCDFNWILSQTLLRDVRAVKNQEIYEIDSAIILQPGPALFEVGVDEIQKIIHGYYKRYLIPKKNSRN